MDETTHDEPLPIEQAIDDRVASSVQAHVTDLHAQIAKGVADGLSSHQPKRKLTFKEYTAREAEKTTTP